MKNIEKIRAMDVFDLADFLREIADHCYNMARCGIEGCEDCPLQDGCEKSLAEWLESEAKEGMNRCIICGREIPEGRQICPICEGKSK